MKTKRNFGELELLILESVKQKSQASVHDIHAMLKEDIAYTTVMTVMHRLFEKKLLHRKKEGRSFVYWSTEKSLSPLLNFFDKLKHTIFGKTQSFKIISSFLENHEEISPKDLETIESLIQKAKTRKKNK